MTELLYLPYSQIKGSQSFVWQDNIEFFTRLILHDPPLHIDPIEVYWNELHGCYTIQDGHSRAVAWYLLGETALPTLETSLGIWKRPHKRLIPIPQIDIVQRDNGHEPRKIKYF